MLRTLPRFVIALSLAAGVIQPATAAPPKFRIVTYERDHGPPGVLVEGTPGVFYTNSGGHPAAYSVTTDGMQTILTTLPSRELFYGPFVSASNGAFYGGLSFPGLTYAIISVTSVPGMTTYPTQTVAPEFTQNLPGGELLGLAGSGTVYSLVKATLDGTLTSIYQFPSTEMLPDTAIYATDGNYYGVSYVHSGSGYVYRITPSGTRTNVHTFPEQTFTNSPIPLFQAGDGDLYGATNYGSANGGGTIYKLSLSGKYTLLYSFPARPQYHPTALIEGSDGNLYGASGLTGSAGLLFRITKAGDYTELHALTNATKDGACLCLLTLGSDGIIYGSATYGGVTGGGDIFALDVGLPKPSPRALHFKPQSGPAGTQVLIWGYDLLSASVSFNGVAATAVSNSGANYVFATVPAGATSGPITVTTPGGTWTTKASFTIN